MTGSVGLDLVDVPRLAAALARRPGMRARLFTERELADASDRPERLAARFAAKEATWKALGVGLGATGFHDVSVARGPDGRPELVLSGRAARLADERGLTTWWVSLSHTEGLAGAVVMGESS